MEIEQIMAKALDEANGCRVSVTKLVGRLNRMSSPTEYTVYGAKIQFSEAVKRYSKLLFQSYSKRYCKKEADERLITMVSSTKTESAKNPEEFMHTLQMMEALHTISSAQAYLSTPSETKISRSLILKEKEAYLARLHKSLQVLKQEMATSLAQSDIPKVRLGAVRLFRACMVTAKMHTHFDKQLSNCIVKDAMKKGRKPQKLEQLGVVEIKWLEEVLDYIALVCPKPVEESKPTKGSA